MKSKDSPSLYEILRTASQSMPGGTGIPSATPSRSTVTEDASPKTLKERLAAYKASKMGISPPTTTPVPRPEPRPMLTPVPRHDQAAPQAPGGPGERIIRLTYNTAAFLGLVGLGLMFIVYSVGVRSGRASAEVPAVGPVEDSASSTAVEAPRAPETRDVIAPPAPPQRVFSIHLIEWEAGTAAKRLDAQRFASNLKKVLDQAGHPGVEPMLVRRNGKEFVALYIGRFSSRSSAEAKAKLAAVRKVKYRNRAYFSRAGFEEITP